jgi:hypothetical protein
LVTSEPLLKLRSPSSLFGAPRIAGSDLHATAQVVAERVVPAHLDVGIADVDLERERRRGEQCGKGDRCRATAQGLRCEDGMHGSEFPSF